MSSAQCIICLDCLFISTDRVAAAQCGHVFHQGCIIPWLNQTSKCPVCKVNISSNDIVTPLYLSASEDSELTTTPEGFAQLHVKYMEQQNMTAQLEREKILLQKQLSEEKERGVRAARDVRRMEKQLQYMKQIRRVAELDDLMRSPTAKAFIRKIDESSGGELRSQSKAMLARLTKAHTERKIQEERASLLQRENLHLRNKVKRLEGKLRSAEGSGLPPEATTAAQVPNEDIILLDSDDECDNGRYNINDTNDSDIEEVLTVCL